MSDTRTRILEAAERLLKHRGVAGTSLSDILEISDAPRGSLYHHFPGGKDEIVLEATRAGIQRVTVFLRECFAPGRDPAERVREYVEATASELEASGYRFGCPVAPLVLDAPETSELAEACRDALAEWKAILRGSFEAAGIETGRASALAILVMSAIEGALILARAQGTPRPFEDLAAELETSVRQAIP